MHNNDYWIALACEMGKLWHHIELLERRLDRFEAGPEPTAPELVGAPHPADETGDTVVWLVKPADDMGGKPS